jgi:hypothetical protein
MKRNDFVFMGVMFVYLKGAYMRQENVYRVYCYRIVVGLSSTSNSNISAYRLTTELHVMVNVFAASR